MMEKKLKKIEQGFASNRGKESFKITLTVFENCQSIEIVTVDDHKLNYYEIIGALSHQVAAMQFDQIQRNREEWNRTVLTQPAKNKEDER